MYLKYSELLRAFQKTFDSTSFNEQSIDLHGLKMKNKYCQAYFNEGKKYISRSILKEYSSVKKLKINKIK